MTSNEVQAMVAHEAGEIREKNHHDAFLVDLLVRPEEITVIERSVREGKASDRLLTAWLVAQEPGEDGYRIVMSTDGSTFGLASPGFQSDPFLVLCGWYGDLESAFMCM